MLTRTRLIPLIPLALAAAAVVLPWAAAGPATQFPQTGEPPLPGQQLKPVPVVPFQPQDQQAMPIFPGASGTLCPVDPPAPLVTMKVRVAACGAAGQELEYRICIENCSPSPAHHVVVRNPLPPNARFVRASPVPNVTAPELQWHLGTLEPGASKDIVLVLLPADTADVKNCARVQFEHGQCVVTRIAKAPPGVEEPPKVKPMDPPKVITPSDAKLTIRVTGPRQQYANLAAKYQITVTNVGDSVAGNVLITAFLPEQSKFLQASDDGRFLYKEVAWLIGDLPAGASRTVQLVYQVSAAGEYCVKAAAMAERGRKVEDDFCTRFEGASAMLLQMGGTKNPLGIGERMSYRIVVTNQGQVSLTNIQVKALVSPLLQTMRATGPTDPGSKLPDPTPQGQAVIYQPLKELKAGEEQVFEVFVKGLQPGDARFRVIVTADQLVAGGPVIEEESTTVFSEALPTSRLKK